MMVFICLYGMLRGFGEGMTLKGEEDCVMVSLWYQ